MELFLQSWPPLVADWLALTVANPAYAATIAGIVWLLTAMLGAIRARGLKKVIRRTEQLGQQLQQALDDANGQLHSTLQSLATSQEQMVQAKADADQAQLTASALHTLLVQRNNQIAGVIQRLSISFDMGERPIAVTEDVQADTLWEQHDRTLNQLIASLRAESQAKIAWQNDCQSEVAKRAALEAQVVPLQAQLGEHSGQIEALMTKQNDYINHIGLLQQKLVEQNDLYLQLEQQTEASLGHFAECHEADAQRLEELKQQLGELEHYKIQNSQLQASLAAKEGEIAHWQDQAKALQVNTLPAQVADNDEVAELATHNNEAQHLQEQPIVPALPDDNAATPPSEELLAPTTPDIVADFPAEPPVEEPTEQESEAVVTDVEAVALPEVQATEEHNALGFMKNLFGKNKAAPIEEVAEAVTEVEPEQAAEASVTDAEAVALPEVQATEEHNALGFMKNLFGKNKAAPIEEVAEAVTEVEPEQAAEASVTDAEAVALPEVQATEEHNALGFMKNLFGKNKAAPIEEAEEVVAIKHSEPDTLVQHTADSAEHPVSSDPLGFMKNIFKNKQPVEPEQPLTIVEERSEPEIAEPVADNQAFGFMKKLFVKTEPEPIVLEQTPEPPIAPEETSAKPADPLKGFYRLFSMKNKSSNEEG